MALVNVLAIRLEAVTGAFQAGIGQAQKALAGLKGAFDKATSGLQKFLERNNTLGKALGNLKNAVAGIHPGVALAVGAVAGLGVAMSRAIRESTALADELTLVSKRTGVSVEALSELRFVASQNEVEFGALALGLRQLQRTQIAAIRGSKAAAQAFKNVGISVEQLRANKTEDVLELVADGLAKTSDGAKRTANSFALMGRGAGPALVPLLAQGGEAIRKAREEARRFGAQISSTFAARADEYGDNLGKLKTLQNAFSIQLAQAVIPALNSFVTALFPIAIELLPLFTKALEFAVFGLTKAALFIQRVVVGFQQWGALLKGDKERVAELGEKLKALDEKLFESKAAFDARTEAMLSAVPVTRELAEETETLTAALDDSLAAQRKALEGREGLEMIPGGAPGLGRVSREFRPPPATGDTLASVPLDFQSNFEKANESVLAAWEDNFARMTDIAQEAFQGFSTLADNFAEALTSGADIAKIRFGDFFKDLLKSIARAIVRALVLRAILSFFGGTGIGGFLKQVQAGIASSGLGAALQTQQDEGPFEAGVLGNTAIARRTLAAQSAPSVGAGGSLFRPTVVVNEATPRTWIEITDRHVAPRLRQRLRHLGDEDFARGK